MIIDRVENAHLYHGMGTHIDAALRFMEETDLSVVDRVTLDDGAVRISSVSYMSKPVEQCNKENHRLDADIHVCVEGVEVFGYCNLRYAVPVTEYDPEKDKQFYDAKMGYIRLLPGMFALVMPDDVHSAMTADGEPAPAKKVLFKCRIAE